MAELRIVELWNTIKRLSDISKKQNKFLTRANLGQVQLSDFDFLTKVEKTIDSNGTALKQSYQHNGVEVLFIRYTKFYENIIIDGVNYVDEFIAYQDDIIYLDTNGNEAQSKLKQRVDFTLTSYLDLAGNIAGISSVYRNDYLAKERKNWEKKMRDDNPEFFKMLRKAYANEFITYMEDGDKADLVSKLNLDANYTGAVQERLDRKAILNKTYKLTVYTVLQVILSTLQ